MQRTIMMSKNLYQTWLKPRLKKVVDAARAIRPDVIIFYHSCGFVEPFIEDLIEAGIDVLNPVQPECMDFGEIHAKYGDRLSFHGTIGTQTTMPFGTPEQVRAEVFRNLDIAGRKAASWSRPPIFWSRKCPGRTSGLTSRPAGIIHGKLSWVHRLLSR